MRRPKDSINQNLQGCIHHLRERVKIQGKLNVALDHLLRCNQWLQLVIRSQIIIIKLWSSDLRWSDVMKPHCHMKIELCVILVV